MQFRYLIWPFLVKKNCRSTINEFVKLLIFQQTKKVNKSTSWSSVFLLHQMSNWNVFTCKLHCNLKIKKMFVILRCVERERKIKTFNWNTQSKLSWVKYTEKKSASMKRMDVGAHTRDWESVLCLPLVRSIIKHILNFIQM